MSATLPPVAERITGAATLGRLILSAAERGDDVALRRPAGERMESVTYNELAVAARAVARGLIALGIAPGERVAILSSTRAEWTICEAGAVCAGAVVVPVYHTNSPEECRHVLAHSGARLVFCEDEQQLAKIAVIREACPQLEHVVAIEGEDSVSMGLAEFTRRGDGVADEEIELRVQQVQPADVATIVYTSGTTGPPKGCELTHANFLGATAMYRGQLELDDVQPVIYMFLPLAHVLARIAQVVVLDIGGTLVYWRGDPARVLEEIMEAAPTHLVAVPRIYEKLHAGVLSAVESRGRLGRLLFAWALEVGRRARVPPRSGRDRAGIGRIRLGAADRVGLARVRGLFGPQLKMALVGAAPIDRELLEFFGACGVLVLEGYGLTESCAAATLNPPGAPVLGTVGRALPGSEVMVADDGEVLLRGPQVFSAYHDDPGETAAAFAGDWLRTGDMGELSPEGYLTLTGRKKELIITSSGKNITPVNVENALRESRWIADAVVYGDRRPYLVCLLTLDPDGLPVLAERFGVEADPAALAREEGVHALLQTEVDHANARLSRAEGVKRFAVLDHDLSQAGGELTPTLKVKRDVVYDRYAEIFESLYREPETAP